MKKQDFKKVSMTGRLAYLILCFEKFLLEKYPKRDFTELSILLWKGTNSMWWDDYYELMNDLSSEFLLASNTFKNENFSQLNEIDFKIMKKTLEGIEKTTDEWFTILHDLASIYAYSPIPKYGKESIDIIFKAKEILDKNNIELPDIKLVNFSSFNEKNGWGNRFDGSELSLILRQ